MGEPFLTATFSLGIAAVLTAAIAIGTSAKAYVVRAIKLTAISVLIAVATVASEHACLRINFTASVPIGLYLLLPLPSSGVKRGCWSPPVLPPLQHTSAVVVAISRPGPAPRTRNCC